MKYDVTPKVVQDRSLSAKMVAKHREAEVERLRKKFAGTEQTYENQEG
jgi:hypothetical protein